MCPDTATCESCQTTLCFTNNTCLTCPSGTYPSKTDQLCLRNFFQECLLNL